MDRLPHTSDFVNLNGIRLHYLDWGGNGPALLFLAGRGCNAYVFDDFAPLFTGCFHVLGLTRRGHGDSDYPKIGYDIDTLAEDIRQFIDCLGIQQVILAGHSLAGIELTHLAALYPERVLKLVYLDAAYDYSSPKYKALLEQNPMRNFRIPGSEQEFHSPEEYAAFITFAYPSLGAIWNEMMDEHLLHQIEFSPDGKVVEKMPDEIDHAISDTIAAYRPEYAQIRAPALGIFAVKKNTYFVSTEYMTREQQVEMIEFFNHVYAPWNDDSLEQFRQETPHARIFKIPDGHHYCHIQQADLVYKEMMAFLTD